MRRPEISKQGSGTSNEKPYSDSVVRHDSKQNTKRSRRETRNALSTGRLAKEQTTDRFSGLLNEEAINHQRGDVNMNDFY